ILQLSPQPQDLIDELSSGLVRAGSRPSRARLEGLVAAGAEPPDQFVDPALREPVRPGDIADAPALQNHGVDQVARHPHTGTPFIGCPVSTETSVRDVLKPHTSLSVSLPLRPAHRRAGARA